MGSALFLNLKFFKLIWLVLTVPLIFNCGSNSVGTDDKTQNQPPVVNSFMAEPNIVSIGGTTSVIVSAEDPENDILSFGWSASGGSITGSGPSAVWTAPENIGTYIISIFVEDDRLGAANRTLTIQVVDGGSDNRPPIINYINASPDIIPALGNTGLTVGATDPDGNDSFLTYFWGGPGGSFEGDDHNVIWTSPPPACCPTIYSIWVVVRDSLGATNTRTVEVTVIP
jgi:hypothetical protein